MPNVTVYIRTGDMEAWRNLPKKSEAIHNMLAAKRRNDYLLNQRMEKLKEPTQAAPAIVNKPDTGAATQLTQQPTVPITPPQPAPTHLTDKLPENIRGAFVKADTIAPPPKPTEEMPCCKEASPCKHWVWNINEGDGYVNTISGRKKITE